MKKQVRSTICLLLILISSVSVFSQSIFKEEVEKNRKEIVDSGKDIDWELFDSTSNVSVDRIKLEDIQGFWKSYDGLFRFGKMVNTMVLTTPMTIKFNGEKMTINNSKPEKFTLDGNKIISKKGDFSAIINRITDAQLVITLKRNENYTRYYYEKSNL